MDVAFADQNSLFMVLRFRLWLINFAFWKLILFLRTTLPLTNYPSNKPK